MELACDERTVRGLAEEERKQYAFTLLSYARKEMSMYASAFGSSKIKVRIERVVSYKRITVCSSIALSVLFCVLMIFLLSNR